jgi:hypothetical protein
MRQDACDIGEEAAKAHTAPGHVLCVGAGRQPPEVHTTSATHQVRLGWSRDMTARRQCTCQRLAATLDWSLITSTQLGYASLL